MNTRTQKLTHAHRSYHADPEVDTSARRYLALPAGRLKDQVMFAKYVQEEHVLLPYLDALKARAVRW